MDLSGWIIPLGVVSYAFMLLAVLTGTRIIKLKVKHHKMLALIGIVGATVHLFIVIYLNYL